MKRRAGAKLRVRVRVAPHALDAPYSVALGFAETDDDPYCAGVPDAPRRLFNLRIGPRTIQGLNVYKKAGCNSALMRFFDDVVPAPDGAIEIAITTRRGDAVLQTLCVKRSRHTKATPVASPSASPRESPSASPPASASPPPSLPPLIAPSRCQRPGCRRTARR